MLFMRKLPHFAELNGHEDHNVIAFIAESHSLADKPHHCRMNENNYKNI